VKKTQEADNEQIVVTKITKRTGGILSLLQKIIIIVGPGDIKNFSPQTNPTLSLFLSAWPCNPMSNLKQQQHSEWQQEQHKCHRQSAAAAAGQKQQEQQQVRSSRSAAAAAAAAGQQQ
jgi:hypothetical protein